MIDKIIEHNRKFVESKGYEPFITSKYPDKNLAILSCMDTRLTELLPAALGIKNGDAKLIKIAGGTMLHPFGSAMRSLIIGIYELNVTEIMVIAHSDCGACHLNGKHMVELMRKRGISNDIIATVNRCGINIEDWLEGFHDTVASVRKSVETIKSHPLVPKDIRVNGFIIDSQTGELSMVDTSK